jgi:hypothetical protein
VGNDGCVSASTELRIAPRMVIEDSPSLALPALRVATTPLGDGCCGGGLSTPLPGIVGTHRP